MSQFTFANIFAGRKKFVGGQIHTFMHKRLVVIDKTTCTMFNFFLVENPLYMKTYWPLLPLIYILLLSTAHAEDEELIKDLSSRYDFVGIITHTSNYKWAKNNNLSKEGRLFPIDPEKISGGILYIGLAKENDTEFPFFGEIYTKGKLYGYNNVLFVRIREVNGNQMKAIDDDSNDYVIKVIHSGSGYKRK